MTRRLRIPAKLTISAIGLGAVSCGPAPTPDAGTDVAVDTASDASGDVVTEGGLNCEAACTAMFSRPTTQCTAVTIADGAMACTEINDASSSGFCSIAQVAMASTGPCCCEPAI